LAPWHSSEWFSKEPIQQNETKQTLGQFHQHFLYQNKAAFAQIILISFDGNSIQQKCTKIWQSVQKLQPRICINFSPEMLVKQNSLFCDIYLMLMPVRIRPIGQLNQHQYIKDDTH